MIEIIPAIDLIDGKCVRLTQGDYDQKTIYSNNPLDVALQFEDCGIKRLHLVDLDGAKKGEVVNFKTLERIASKTKLVIDFGGGIKSNEAIANVYNAGATMATIGSIAVKQPELFFSWIEKYSANKLFLGADVSDEKIAVSGWIEKTDISILEFIKQNMQRGIESLFCTDIAKDGMLQGASTDLYKKIIDAFPQLKLVASGGVANMKGVVGLEKIGCSGVIIGKAIYEGGITLQELKNYYNRVC